MMDDPSIKVKATDDGVKIRVNEPGVRATEEPIEEFSTMDFDRGRGGVGGVGNLVGQVGRLYFNVLTLPLNLLPRRSRYHAKNSIREGFLSFKTLIDDVTGSIDDGLNRSLQRDRLRMDDYDDVIRPADNVVRPASPYATPYTTANDPTTIGGGAI